MKSTIPQDVQRGSSGSSRSARGQTLIIALIVLGLLLILGFVFLGIVDGNIRGGANAKVRSQSNDLAEAGVRFAQQQLVFSPAGADWRGLPTTLSTVAGNANNTTDPDAYYLRGAATDANGNPLLFPGSTTIQDLGGPDGLGPFIRINYDQGRALIRVRYGPSDANIFSTTPEGPLRNPGKLHNYLIIESVGREGVVNTNDPTTLLAGDGVQFQNFSDQAALATALSTMKQFDSQVVNSRHLLALSTTGLVDNARFITNKFNQNRAADIGIPNPNETFNNVSGEYLPGLGVNYNGADVGSLLTYTLGTSGTIAAPTNNPVPTGFGSLQSNADVSFHGTSIFDINDQFGDGIRVAGNITGDANAVIGINESTFNSTTDMWTQMATQNLTPAQFSSRSSTFNSGNGILLDGVAGTDVNGNPRGVGRLVPPSILQADPQTGVNRYLALTRDTMGAQGANGHGNGIYVSNTLDEQGPTDEAGRAGTGATESLLYDILNPNNGSVNSAWNGPFYVPPAATVEFLPDGFTIQLDQNAQWPGLSTNTLRYRVGRYNGQLTIVDSSQDPADINSSTGVKFSAGQAFNGVLYFEGNVQVRGLIPTDVQLTLVSGANIYINGAITKGVTGNDFTDSFPTTNTAYAAYGTVLGRPSKSALMLMARENVIVNPTQFVGLQPGQQATTVNDQQNDSGFNAVSMSETPGSSGTSQIDLVGDLLIDPNSGTNGAPNTQTPFAMEYKDSLTNQPLNTKLLLTHTMADGGGAASLIGMNINLGATSAAASQFYFPGSPGLHLPANYPQIDNTASDYLLQTGALTNASTSINQYGLGKEPWQRYDKFESRGFDIIYPQSSAYNETTGLLTATSGAADPFINYVLFAPGSNDFLISPSSITGVPTNDYYLARAALAPADIEIEASVFAEEGSFLVIPGPWYNPNPNDTRAAYVASVGANGQTIADQNRLTDYGNAPEIPFYGEPLDVRVQVIGSVSENMPPPLSVQVEEVKKQGWIPLSIGSSGTSIPTQQIPSGQTAANLALIPNFTVSYDPDVATGRIGGFVNNNSPTTYLRTDNYGRPELPMPRLPVSPALTYFGDLQ